MTEKIGTRTFTADDLRWFAAASGDWNPIHIDPLAARRLIAGRMVVHGMFTMLASLECHFATSSDVPQRITAYFQKPVFVGEDLDIWREKDGQDIRLSIRRGNEEMASVRLAGKGSKAQGQPVAERPLQGMPKDRKFDDMREASGHMTVSASAEDITQAFAHTANVLGSLPVASIMALSCIVGMECPGLHSLFTGIDIALGGDETAQLGWKVVRHTSPYAPLKIGVEGASISGTLDAFVRPEPVAQPAMAEVAKLTEPEAFTGQKALIIGGSRGLGELVAKLIAAGGGQVTITYASGLADAKRVADEIRAAGGNCDIMQFDAENIHMPVLKQPPTHLYYFATPRIASQRGGVFDEAVYAAFCRIYVQAFEWLVQALAQQQADLSVFYPSTVFIDERPKDFAEYIAAKEAGEALCLKLEAQFPNLRILISRLPRMKTDQTASLLPLPAKPALQEIERVVRQMHVLTKQKSYEKRSITH